MKVLDEGVYPAVGATTLCRCDLPEKLDESHIAKLTSGCSPTVPRSNFSSSRSKRVKAVKRGVVGTRSQMSVVEQLSSARHEIKHLAESIKRYEEEHVELHMERVNSLIRSVHLIKRNAVDGDINAILLLNQIATYATPEEM